ncbi:MAG TPA: hypothetical protein VEI52_21520 [Terriglobales bacterium]|nr:hypothetical protein [Terriglobales bacterium]
MSEAQTAQNEAGARVIYERCLCRETLDHLKEHFKVSPAVSEHLANSRIEFLKAIRAVIDARIEHLSGGAQRGTKVVVE